MATRNFNSFEKKAESDKQIWYWKDSAGSQCGQAPKWRYEVQVGHFVRPDYGVYPQGNPWQEFEISEDYALQHSREYDQKISSVFTGLYFKASDEPQYGVLIPLKFWKVITFVHDEIEELCATDYEMSQQNNLKRLEDDQEFVLPQLNISTQVPIATIEARAGLSFGGLPAADPLSREGVGGPAGPLLFPEQIRFL